MNTRLSKLKEKIDYIDTLRKEKDFGPKYSVWENTTEKLLVNFFGKDASSLFKEQQSVAINDEAYYKELNAREKLLNELLTNHTEYIPEAQLTGNNNPNSVFWKDALSFIFKHIVNIVVGVLVIAIAVWLKLTH